MTDPRGIELGRTAWLQILQSACRLRPLFDGLSLTRLHYDRPLVELIAETALDDYHALRHRYEAEETKGGLGHYFEIDGHMLASMRDLLAISAVATCLLETNRLAAADYNDVASTIDALIISIEARLGGVHPELDASVPEGWAEATLQ